MRPLLALVAVVLLLAGCLGHLTYRSNDLPQLFVSPLAAPGPEYRLYVPNVVGAPNKLGVGGCGPCAVLGCSWCYAWVPNPGPGAPGIEAVPMIRDAGDVNVAQLGGNSDWLMLFNEPDLCPDQACLSPDAAAVLHRQVAERWPDKKLVAAAPSHQHPEWLVQWWNAYVVRYDEAPRVDALAMHCYHRTAAACIALAQQFEGLAQLWGIREGWVTEFAFTPVVANWQAQIAEFTAYLERSAFWTRYAPFVSYETCDNVYWNCAASGDPSLLTADGRLTDIGRLYQHARE